MVGEITHKQAIIFASGHYLTEHLPDEYDEWTDEELDSHLLEFVWQPFEYHSAEQIWEHIENLAYDFKETIKHQLKERTWAEKERLQE